MTAKSSISLSDRQNDFIRDLVKQGRYPSVSAALQHGVELLRSKFEAEEAEITALRTIIEARRDGQFVSGARMQETISSIADKKRREHGL
jgi:antitoxin ParD1/3/4